MNWRVGITDRVIAALREASIAPKRIRVGQTHVYYLNGERMNAATLAELVQLASRQIERGATVGAVERAIRQLAVDETPEERKEREADKRAKIEAEKAEQRAASDAKKGRDAVVRQEAVKATLEAKNRPPRAEWFDQFTFDSKARLDRFAAVFLGASEHDSRMFSAWLIGCCRRFGKHPGTPLIVNAAFSGAPEDETESALRALFEPFLSTFFDGDSDPRHFASRTLGNFLIFVRSTDRTDALAFEILTRRTHDVIGDDAPVPRTFALAIALRPNEEVPSFFRKIEVKRWDIEAIRKYRAALIGEAKARALKPIRFDATKRVRAKRQRWLRDYVQRGGFNGN